VGGEAPVGPAGGVPGPTVRLDAVFSDALNLPDGAHVKLNGDDIGRVQEITARDYTAHVSMAVRADVALPAGTRAELRQATPLGEVFVALHPPEHPVSGAVLRDGDTLGLPDTAAAASVEDLLASTSALVNGGGLAQIQTIVHEVNSAFEGRAPQTAHLLGQSRQLMATLNARTEDIDRVLAASRRLTETLNQRRGTIDAAFADLTPGIRVLAEQTDRLVDALDAAGRLGDSGDRLIRRTDHDLRSVARDLGPILDAFADTRDTLGPNLRDLVAFGRVFGRQTEGEAFAGIGAAQLAPLIALPGPGDRLPGPTDLADGSRSFTETLQHQFALAGGAR
jgi:virulence factor Mce-like protein